MDQGRRKASGYGRWLWNAKTRVPQYLLSRRPGFLVRSNWGKKPAACQGGFINNLTGPPANPLKVQLYKLRYKFLVWGVSPGRWALFTAQHEAHGRRAVPSPHEAASVAHHRDTAVVARRGMFPDAEVGDFPMEIFYTRIWSGLASLCVLLLGNIFLFRAIICSAKNENTVNMINVASTQWVQNFSLSRYALHSWSSCMWRKRFRYSLGSSNWEGMGNMDS